MLIWHQPGFKQHPARLKTAVFLWSVKHEVVNWTLFKVISKKTTDRPCWQLIFCRIAAGRLTSAEKEAETRMWLYTSTLTLSHIHHIFMFRLAASKPDQTLLSPQVLKFQSFFFLTVVYTLQLLSANMSCMPLFFQDRMIMTDFGRSHTKKPVWS